jgi:hypothetical protein
MPKTTQALSWDFERRRRETLNNEALESAQLELSRAELLNRLDSHGEDEDDMWDDDEEDEAIEG